MRLTQKKLSEADLFSTLCEQLELDCERADIDSAVMDKITAMQQRDQAHEKALHKRDADIRRLTRYMDQMVYYSESIRRSRSWKLSIGLIGLAKRLMGRPRGTDAFHQLENTVDVYNHWKKSRD